MTPPILIISSLVYTNIDIAIIGRSIKWPFNLSEVNNTWSSNYKCYCQNFFHYDTQTLHEAADRSIKFSNLMSMDKYKFQYKAIILPQIEFTREKIHIADPNNWIYVNSTWKTIASWNELKLEAISFED